MPRKGRVRREGPVRHEVGIGDDRQVLGLKRRQRSAVFTKRAGVNRMLQESERKAYFKKHGTPHIGLDGATGPYDVFGDQYLVWGREMREKAAEPKVGKGGGIVTAEPNPFRLRLGE